MIIMLARILKRTIALCVLLGFLGQARAFSPLGPYETWMAADLGYAGDNGQIGGPMSLLSTFRWNVPVITYAYDESFIDYFGTNGIKAIDQAIAMITNLPPASQITNDANRLYIRGVPVPFRTQQINYGAQLGGLVDLKSYVMPFFLEEIGLTTSEQFVWTLRAAPTVGGVHFYSVIKRNFDPITLTADHRPRPSSYVNGALYTYVIEDDRPLPGWATALEVPVNSPQLPYSSVTSAYWSDEDEIGGGALGQILPGLNFGEYFTGLTHG